MLVSKEKIQSKETLACKYGSWVGYYTERRGYVSKNFTPSGEVMSYLLLLMPRGEIWCLKIFRPRGEVMSHLLQE